MSNIRAQYRWFPRNQRIFRNLDNALTTTTIDDASPRRNPSSPCERREEDPWPTSAFDLAKRPSLYVVAAASNVAAAVERLGRSVIRCPDEVRPGAFNSGNVILFLLQSSEVNGTMADHGVGSIFSDPNVQMHRRVAAVSRRPRRGLKSDDHGPLLVARFNIYSDSTVKNAIPVDEAASALFLPFDMKVKNLSFHLILMIFLHLNSNNMSDFFMTNHEKIWKKNLNFICISGLFYWSWISALRPMDLC